MRPTACLLLPYFGTLPKWFPEFLTTCAPNHRFRWIIFTDDPTHYSLPSNVSINRSSFESYKAHASGRLGIDVSALGPYKLTDLKPFLGVIHSDEIDNAAYWGFCDLDILFGDLWQFLREPMTRGASVISMHDRRVSGHFCLLRNLPGVRRKCFSVPGWEGELTRSDHVSFDEYQFSNHLFFLQRLLGRWYAFKWYRLMRAAGLGGLLDLHFHAREAFTTPLSAIPWRDGSRFWEQPLEWEWKNGRVFSVRDGVEAPYVHFMNYKSPKWFAENIRRAADGNYYPDPPDGHRYDVVPWSGLTCVVRLKLAQGQQPERIRIDLSGIEVG